MPDDARTRLLGNSSNQDSSSHSTPTKQRLETCRAYGRRTLDSHRKHYLVMAIVVLDVLALLANILVQLIACELGEADEKWVGITTEVLEKAGLVFSCLFALELLLCLFSFGFGYFATAFHLFDSAVIVLSLVIDIAAQGLTESIGSLVVVLRLWRLVKISEEVMLGASERMAGLEQELGDLEAENKHLREQLDSQA